MDVNAYLRTTDSFLRATLRATAGEVLKAQELRDKNLATHIANRVGEMIK